MCRSHLLCVALRTGNPSLTACLAHRLGGADLCLVHCARCPQWFALSQPVVDGPSKLSGCSARLPRLLDTPPSLGWWPFVQRLRRGRSACRLPLPSGLWGRRGLGSCTSGSPQRGTHCPRLGAARTLRRRPRRRRGGDHRAVSREGQQGAFAGLPPLATEGIMPVRWVRERCGPACRWPWCRLCLHASRRPAGSLLFAAWCGGRQPTGFFFSPLAAARVPLV